MKQTARRVLKRPIDSAWFTERIAATPFGSMRGICDAMGQRLGVGFDVAKVSRTLSGFRKLRLEEARALADLLAVPLAEVLRRAGIDVRDREDDIEARHRAAVRMVRTLLAFIDEAGVAMPAKVREHARAID